MQIPTLFDSNIARLAYGLDGLSERQQLIASNIANVDTPGYLTQDVPFEQTLQQSLAQPGNGPTTGAPPPLPGAVARNDLKVRNDGNNVDLDQQMTQLAQTTVQYQAASQLITGQFALLSSAIAPIA